MEKAKERSDVSGNRCGPDKDRSGQREDRPERDKNQNFRLKYGGRYCCVVRCHNNSYKHVPLGIKFHGFPKDPERRQLWVRALRRAVPGKPGSLWQPKSHDVVCSEHFVDGKKSDDKSSPSFSPSIFPTHDLTESDLGRKRRERREARSNLSDPESGEPLHKKSKTGM